jgi:uncharacterized membrane protein
VSHTDHPLEPDAEARASRVELLISYLLRIGVVTSLVVIVLGIILMFAAHPEYLSSTRGYRELTHPAERAPFDIGGIFSGAIRGDGESVIMLGFLILVMTPVLRVAVSTLVFVYQKDRVFTVITLVVLGILLLSYMLGGIGHG